MASIVDICNLALGHLGDEANVQAIDPPDGTAQAYHCARFYPIAVDTLLESHTWGFATYREDWAELAVPTTSSWQHEYLIPSYALRVNSVLPADSEETAGLGMDENNYPYLVEGGRLLTNVEKAKVKFTKKIYDSTMFTPLFVDVLSFHLATYLAGPILKGDTGLKVSLNMAKLVEQKLAIAKAKDANASKFKAEHMPDHLSKRGVTLTAAQRATPWRR